MAARARVLYEVDRWMGTRYRHGGNGKNGFDCSGFVNRVFRDALGVSLPRTTRAQMRVGTDVEKDELQFADLVFFRTPARTDHVGIYLGDGEFVHASSSSGVMISHLAEDYWRKSYRSARRPVKLYDADLDITGTGADNSNGERLAEIRIPEQPPLSTTPLTSPPPRQTPRRIGW